ncbi:hypothetical protein EYR36_001730 [Pleurotus pulmonarius]|nr:hypothetical protein EYR36_001730 [Pleurotus pulmonarius]
MNIQYKYILTDIPIQHPAHTPTNHDARKRPREPKRQRRRPETREPHEQHRLPAHPVREPGPMEDRERLGEEEERLNEAGVEPDLVLVAAGDAERADEVGDVGVDGVREEEEEVGVRAERRRVGGDAAEEVLTE